MTQAMYAWSKIFIYRCWMTKCRASEFYSTYMFCVYVCCCCFCFKFVLSFSRIYSFYIPPTMYSIFPHNFQHFMMSLFFYFILAILMDVQWNLPTVLICICIFSLVKCLHALAHFLNVLSGFLLLSSIEFFTYFMSLFSVMWFKRIFFL